MARFPDYSDSILGVPAAICEHFGVHSGAPNKALLKALEEARPENVVFLLLDGMGDALIRRHLKGGGFFSSHRADVIDSVFPPTTTAATTSFDTGLPPISHGWLGWSLYFDELGKTVDIFSNRESGTEEQAAPFHAARALLPYTGIGERIAQTGAGYCKISPVNDAALTSPRALCEKIREACAEPGRKFVDAYWHQPDYDMHEFGTSSPGIKALLEELEAEVEALCAALSNSLVIVSADHGMADVEQKYLTDYPEIADCFLRPPSVEGRALSCFIKPGRQAEFEARFLSSFGGEYTLLPRDEVFARQIFGPGAPHPRVEGFIGEFFAVATGKTLLSWRPSPAGFDFLGAHAGATEEELRVPLIICRCG